MNFGNKTFGEQTALVMSLMQGHKGASFNDVIFALKSFEVLEAIEVVEKWLDEATKEAERLVEEYKEWGISFQAAMDAYKFKTLFPLPEKDLTEEGSEFIIMIAAKQFGISFEEFLRSPNLHSEKIDYFNRAVILIVNHLLYGPTYRK